MTEPRGGLSIRAREVEHLDGLLQQVLAGSGRLVLLSGEPGSGKTFLAEELARRARTAGATVAWGRGWTGDGAPELWPWLQVIRSCLRGVDDAIVPQLVGPHGGELTTLLAPLREYQPLPAGETPAARFRAFNAIAHFLDASARRAPLVIVLDDLERADAASLLLLQFLTQEQRERRLLLCGVYRAPGVALAPALTDMVIEASREPGTERIALTGLSADEIGRLAAALLGWRPSPALAAALRDWSGGNPLYLRESLREHGALLRAAAPPALPLSTELRALLEHRLAPLAESERALIARAVADGVQADSDAATGDAELATARALGLVEAADEPCRVRLVHGVMAAVLPPRPPAAAPTSARPAHAVPQPAPAAPAMAPCVFRREGEYWTIDFAGRTCRLRDVKGLSYLALLLRHPNQALHVSEIIGVGSGSGAAPPLAVSGPVRRGTGDGGIVLDGQAKAEYRRRLADLAAELDDARAANDGGRIARAQHEIDALTDELSAAVGLGGRDRRVGSDVERARVNVTRSVTRALQRIADLHPELGRHLDRCVRTGTFCMYVADRMSADGWLT